MNKKRYITTTLPYVNADPHIGFALEMVQADVLARFWKKQGYDVIFNTGTDEHGLKIYQKALLEERKDPQAYCDEYASKFEKLKEILNLSYTHFIRTTNPKHKKAAQEFWARCLRNGYIDKKLYKIKYCVGCELEKTESELENGRCPLHSDRELEFNEEENYFFKFGLFKEKLLELYDKNPQFVVPNFRLKEIRNFVQGGLEDFSISRLKKKMPWGVDVPGDSKHVMYVWFDALVSYISTLGWPENTEQFKKYWPGVQIAGKDNLRQQSAMWQAMLMAAGLPTSKQIFIHGFITSEGEKMSKSLGNVVSPYDLVNRYGTDAVRYYLLREIPPYDDGDYSNHRFRELYNADLANGLGNIVARITTLCEKHEISIETKSHTSNSSLTGGYEAHIESFQFNLALEELWKDLRQADFDINETEPWKKSKEEISSKLIEWVKTIRDVADALEPFLPKTSGIILAKTTGKIRKISNLFPRV